MGGWAHTAVIDALQAFELWLARIAQGSADRF